MRVLVAIVISFLFFSNCGQKETQLDWAELRPILERLKLTSTTHQTEDYRKTWGLEEADAKAYGPVLGVTIFLKSEYGDRYWVRVEDYSTADAAFKRATDYYVPGETYKRLDKILNETRFADGSAEKNTLRLWAVARGKRVYALTTDTYAVLLDRPRGDLKEAISKLPEK
jgi:hypothetical protein